jgi:hypothetical protein
VGLFEVRFFPALKKIISQHDGKEPGFEFSLAPVSGFSPKKRNAAPGKFFTVRSRRGFFSGIKGSNNSRRMSYEDARVGA